MTNPPASLLPASLLPLIAWLSPSYPVGAFAYSHGLEWAVEAGDIHDAATLGDWVEAALLHGGGRSDAILLAHSWRAVRENAAHLTDIAELGTALSPTKERRLETLQQGRSFMDATLAAWQHEAIAAAARELTDIPYPVAVGIAAGAHNIPLKPAISAFLLAFASNLVSSVVRLGPIGQTDGQRVIARMVPVAEVLATETETASLNDIGGASFRLDIASMNHETQYTRLFRS